ncbi:Sucrase/ferredoxin-like-domain-containing protein [Peziza echinospora]|nr:Sucrase/ferredoxin-like-domain-containing protein [Peziza echinospora]
MVLKNLVSRTKSIFGAATPTDEDGPAVKVTRETLFPSVDPEVDGEECKRDCEGCPVEYPKNWDIDEDSEMWGNVGKYEVHAIVATGKTDWKRDVEDESGSVMQALGKAKLEPKSLMISASNMSPPEEYYTAKEQSKPQPTTVLLLPSFTIVEGVTPAHTPALIQNFILPSPKTTTPLPQSASDTTGPIAHSLRSKECPHSYVVLLCSHKRRDARCGISAPLLAREFERHLRPLGLHRDLSDTRPGGVGLYFINHVGGHRYAANVLVYRKEDGMGLWLGRVAPKHVEGIVKWTILQGKVVHTEMIRGGFYRKEGKVSW